MGSPVVGADMRPGYNYQVPYAEKLRAESGVMSMAVGMIVHADQAEAILQNGRADLVALARESYTTRIGRWMRPANSALRAISAACRRSKPTGAKNVRAQLPI